jgi:hypothetical protein
VKPLTPPQLAQMYRHRSGALLRTSDAHNIFFDPATGQALQDIVSVTPVQNA